MKIIIDAMGGDNAPLEMVKGAVEAVKEFGIEVVLVGRMADVLNALRDCGHEKIPDGVEIANAEEVITMEDDPATAVRAKRDSSMAVALRMLKEGAGDAVVSAGSTGALLTGATLLIGRIKGIRRAALAPMLPSGDGKMLLIDCGANVECSSEYLMQFAYMGSYYMKRISGIEKPRVGLLNIGAEESKGTALTKETYGLLKNASDSGRINFVGNVEARDALLGAADVVVCDGFSGNVFLKTVEGAGALVIGKLKDVFMAGKKSKVAYMLIKDGMHSFKKSIDYNEIGGTAMLGISAPVIKAHGSANAKAFKSAIRQAVEFTNSGVIDDIKANIDYMKLSKEEK